MRLVTKLDRVTIERIGTYSEGDAAGWHLLRRDRESVAGGPFACYEDAKARADYLDLTVMSSRDGEGARHAGLERYGPHAYLNEDGDVRVKGCEAHGSYDPTFGRDVKIAAMCGACRDA